ncbi:ABC transporter substrate-binding protein [Allonocardiopsis opalescens]|uniref:Iron complex transport system substrate-binding protein n=1 Tax=Allonocardiopsis opalescens TaxID=1144618 RepID=A0A2T0Q1M5_9ACTN|nr:ABC transporter substrate-binding protein [Allonocardiopsis opalescens]PRX97703.1 iron complex transport system substrate-binding protein [Allonocardiopsis opalescens]
MVTQRGRSASARTLAAALLLAATAGCGALETAAGSVGTDSREGAITVEHRFGTTTLDAVPERIVTIDLQWTDVMLAMGVEPVGYTVDPFMPESGVPWQQLPADAAALPTVDGLPVERIAELQPDLIVGNHSIADEQTYQLLSEIAPTIPDLDELQVGDWRNLTRAAGQVLGDPEAAQGVIDSVDGEVAAAAGELSALDGRTFALAQYIVGDSLVVVADEQDGSSLFFQGLGMELYPPVATEGAETGQPRLSVSTERSDLLRADLLAFLVNGGDESDLADIPGFDRLPGTVAVLDYPTIVGLNTPTPLSIPHALAELRPYLEEVG